MNATEFATPQDVYRGLDLWMVNDRLDDAELAHQVREFRDKGLYSVISALITGCIPTTRGRNSGTNCALRWTLRANAG